MKTVVIVQARSTSERFPNKILKKIDNKFTVAEYIYNRISKSKLVDEIFFAIPKNIKNYPLYKFLKLKGISTYRGSEKNVLKRFYETSVVAKAKTIVRITGDCPFLDYKLLDAMIKYYRKKKLEFLSNNDPPTFPDGYDIEIFNCNNLKKAFKNSATSYEKEHVTPLIKKISKKKDNYKFLKGNFEFLRLTLDEQQDFDLLKKIVKKIKNIDHTVDDIIKLYKKNPNIFKLKNEVKRNDGSLLGKGQKLWIKSSQVILNSNSLFSKKSELFLPRYWPAYFKKTKGCKILDLNNKSYYDLNLMGVGTNILGYSNTQVDNAVLKVIKNGNLSSLNSFEEVTLAEELLKMNPWAGKVKFARTGGEAACIAIRIARAASGKDKIAFCGYHGWHDWYLSSMINNKHSLNRHLMKDLSTDGVPNFMKNTSFPFSYNKIDELKKIINSKKIGTIIMEVSRNQEPVEDFLKKVRDLATKNNIVLIFDECSSGFRETYGGLNIKYKIDPDIAIFGKALGNGYAINAIVGKENVMQLAKNSFISSTFWSERIGYAAANETLRQMRKKKSWEIISKKGLKIRDEWKKIANQNKLKIKISGLKPMPKFNFLYREDLILKTFITQEMMKKRILASNTMYLSTSHTEKILDTYLDCLNDIFYRISTFENFSDIKKYLFSDVSQSSFKRFN